MVGGITMTTTADTAQGVELQLNEVRLEFIKEQKFVSFKGPPARLADHAIESRA